MATIINNPSTDGDNGMGAIVVALIIGVVIVGALFVMYRVPAFNGPTEDASNGTVIDVPREIDINVNGKNAE